MWPERKHPFLVFEGLSGVGKSTVADLVARRLDTRPIHLPEGRWLAVRDVVDTVSPNARFLFYLSCVVATSGEIQAALLDGSVVCDRYLLTTLAYHRAIGATVKVDPTSLGIIQPDYTFLITCEESERFRRLRARGLTARDAEEEERFIGKRVLSEYRRYSPIEVDNSSPDPMDTAETILALIHGSLSQVPSG